MLPSTKIRLIWISALLNALSMVLLNSILSVCLLGSGYSSVTLEISLEIMQLDLDMGTIDFKCPVERSTSS